MSLAGFIIIGFILLNLLFAFTFRRPTINETAGVADYILANRKLGGFTLLATLAASNLSAFTIFGVSGAAYRSGWAFLPVMAFGTGLMALSFVTIGIPLRRLALAGAWTTPAHFISGRTGSLRLGKAFSILSLVYTLPYLAVQTGSAGNLLAQIGGFPRSLGAALIAGIIALYVFRGGLRSVARTDILQFVALLGLGIAAFIIIAIQASRSGLWLELARSSTVPGPNARTGTDGSQSLMVLAGYFLLWSLANPMFPHFIQRFYAAASDKALLRSMAAYPLVCVVIFVPMTAIGVIGSRLLPGLSNQASDSIFSQLAARMAGHVWGPVFTLAALAALMSTMDSQLLSCSSILVEDFFPKRHRTARTIGLAGLALACGAWIVSLKPPASILGFLGSTAFPGYASLAPVALAALYLPNWYRARQVGDGKSSILIGSSALALLAGTTLVISQAFGLKPTIPAVIFNTIIQAVILLSGMILQIIKTNMAKTTARGPTETRLPVQSTPTQTERLYTLNWLYKNIGSWRPTPATAGIATGLILLVLGLDWWHFGHKPQMAGALPTWVWYHIATPVLMALLYCALAAYILHRDGKHRQ